MRSSFGDWSFPFLGTFSYGVSFGAVAPTTDEHEFIRWPWVVFYCKEICIPYNLRQKVAVPGISAMYHKSNLGGRETTHLGIESNWYGPIDVLLTGILARGARLLLNQWLPPILSPLDIPRRASHANEHVCTTHPSQTSNDIHLRVFSFT